MKGIFNEADLHPDFVRRPLGLPVQIFRPDTDPDTDPEEAGRVDTDTDPEEVGEAVQLDPDPEEAGRVDPDTDPEDAERVDPDQKHERRPNLEPLANAENTFQENQERRVTFPEIFQIFGLRLQTGSALQIRVSIPVLRMLLPMTAKKETIEAQEKDLQRLLEVGNHCNSLRAAVFQLYEQSNRLIDKRLFKQWLDCIDGIFNECRKRTGVINVKVTRLREDL